MVIGVAAVIAVDVGYGQLAWPIRSDERVTVLERTNARRLTRERLPYAPSFVTADLSEHWPGAQAWRDVASGLLAVFIGAAITDWLDGFLARKLNQTSAFGAFLDPVADKFLVCASLLILVHMNRVHVLVALIIIGREIAISSLREWMAQIGAGKSVAVHMVGKLKTTVQMVAIPFLLFDGMLLGQIDTRVWGAVLIWAAAVLTVWSMVYYMQKALPEIRARVK